MRSMIPPVWRTLLSNFWRKSNWSPVYTRTYYSTLAKHRRSRGVRTRTEQASICLKDWLQGFLW
jgi:hypothetical protein